MTVPSRMGTADMEKLGALRVRSTSYYEEKLPVRSVNPRSRSLGTITGRRRPRQDILHDWNKAAEQELKALRNALQSTGMQHRAFEPVALYSSTPASRASQRGSAFRSILEQENQGRVPMSPPYHIDVETEHQNFVNDDLTRRHPTMPTFEAFRQQLPGKDVPSDKYEVYIRLLESVLAATGFGWDNFMPINISQTASPLARKRRRYLRDDRPETQRKLFQCKLCGHEFAFKKTRDRHQEIVHKKRFFQYQMCNQFFARKDSRDRHYAESHSRRRRNYHFDEFPHGFNNSASSHSHKRRPDPNIHQIYAEPEARAKSNQMVMLLGNMTISRDETMSEETKTARNLRNALSCETKCLPVRMSNTPIATAPRPWGLGFRSKDQLSILGRTTGTNLSTLEAARFALSSFPT